MKIVLILINLVPLFATYVSCIGCIENNILSNNRHLNYQIVKPKYEEYESTSGNNITLRCVSPSRRITWHFLPCNEINSYNHKNWTLLRIINLHKSYEYVLHLRNLTEKDSGYYKCSTFNNDNSIKLYKLLIKSKPKKTITSVITNNHDLSYTDVKIKVGESYTITCDNNNKNANIEFALEFLPCVSNKNAICKFDSNVSEKNLFPSSTSNGIKLKNNKIKMFNMTQNQSGLYRCKNTNKTYNIQVTNSRYDGPLPKILEVRRSKILSDSNVLMKCIVYSKITPSINWLKESDKTFHDLQYLDKYYQAVNRSETLLLHDDYIYYGEINVKLVKDVENYVCLAMTQFGKDYETINIDLNNGYTDFQFRTISSLFFLMPLSLIIVPIVVWLCYFKKKDTSDNVTQEVPSQIPLVRKLRTLW